MRHLSSYRSDFPFIQLGATVLLLVMVFIAAEKGFGLWNEVVQDQMELSEHVDSDADNEDSSEEDNDVFLHPSFNQNVLIVSRIMNPMKLLFDLAPFRSDVFTPPPEW